MLRRLSRTLYTCDDPQSLIAALEARGWRRETPQRGAGWLPHELARLLQGAAVIIVYENHEVAARGDAAREVMHAIWARGALH